MAGSYKKAKSPKNRINKYAGKASTNKDAWRNNDKNDKVIDIDATRAYLREFDRPAGKKRSAKR